MTRHQSQLPPDGNKFHIGNGSDGKHYWLTPSEIYEPLDAEFDFDFDPCPWPLPPGFDGLTCEWGRSNYVNPPFGSIIHQGRKKGPTAWVRKAIVECQKGKRVVLVYPVDKWVLMLIKAILGDDHAQIRNLGDVRWLATEDGSPGKGTGRHIACFILAPPKGGHRMRIRLNNKSDELLIEFAGASGKIGDGHAIDAERSFEIPGDVGRGAYVEIDLDGFVRVVRVARLKDILAEFAPRSSGKVRKP